MGKRYTRRQIIQRGSVLAAGSSVFLAAACGGSSSSGSSTTSSSSSIKPKVDGDMTLFTWDGYVAPTVVKGFEKKYGVKVNQTFYDSDEAMVQKVAAGLPYDVITTNSAFMKQLTGANLLARIDASKLSHWDNVLPYFQNPSYDPGAQYSIPYGYGPTGIGYIPSKVQMTGSWNDFWNHPDAAGHIYLLEQSQETIGMSLLRLGYDINSTDPTQVNKATDDIITLKPKLGGFSASGTDNLVSGQGWIQHCWSGDVYQALNQLNNSDGASFQICNDGVPLAVDLQSIGAKAKAPGTAMLFLDWLLEPDNAAKNVAYIGYPTGTKTGNAQYEKITKDYPFLAATAGDSMLKNADWKRELDQAGQQLWSQSWAKIQA